MNPVVESNHPDKVEWYMPVILAFRRLEQEKQKLVTGLSYIKRARLKKKKKKNEISTGEMA